MTNTELCKRIYLQVKPYKKSLVVAMFSMVMVSAFGLGFQLLIIGVLLVVNLDYLIIPFFIAYSFLIPVFILLRRILEKKN